MTEKYKLARVQVIQTAHNTKNLAYIDSKLNVKQEHNFTGDFIEKAVYSSGKVTLYDKKGKEIKQTKPKSKAPSKLSNAPDEKAS